MTLSRPSLSVSTLAIALFATVFQPLMGCPPAPPRDLTLPEWEAELANMFLAGRGESLVRALVAQGIQETQASAWAGQVAQDSAACAFDDVRARLAARAEPFHAYNLGDYGQLYRSFGEFVELANRCYRQGEASIGIKR